MSASATEGIPAPASRPTAPRAARVLWHRQLSQYPDTAARYGYLAIVVAATVVLYYELYIQYAVSTAIITHYNMTFTYFVYVSVVGNAVGAFASLLAGLADRWGRANLTVYGLLVTGALVAFAVPNAGSKGMFLTLIALVSFVEGIILVTTPALVRDFSPQLGRASAMGYWTMGPVVGSLVVTAVTSHTYSGSTTWQDEFRYAGWAGLLVFVMALLGLRELSPRLRDQLMVSLRDRALIEAKAQGLDTEAALRGHWRQMLHTDVVGSALAISLFLLLYFAAVGSFTVYFVTAFGYSVQRTAGLLNWYWAANAVSLVVVGLLSDRAKVRKPFMAIGALASIGVLIPFALAATRPQTGYYTFALLVAGIGVFGGFTYAPWMAGFTETVERRNPAATATGLAVYGWIIRAVVAISSAVLPIVVSSATPLVDHGAQVAAAQAQAGPALAIVQAHPKLFAQLEQYPPSQIPPALQAQAVQEVGIANLLAVQKAGPQLAVLGAYGSQVQQAAAQNPKDWQNWWWVCLGGEAVFIPFIFLMAGRWSPRKAREDLAAHERLIAQQLAQLGADQGTGAAAAS
ncbi:MFS transporter [Actinocrinis puniceicyclus]|uniref:MFS transporter n=1 Tax=Actinocrinis puniceicyclus TaxID=977794 RepID=A0A8J8B9K5_9ACTN|nr:MFS transporter [Actinocrinis puniceicyclus]MBS2961927.1 MFS transporter [Actinocrinis puniceicyclus]